MKSIITNLILASVFIMSCQPKQAKETKETKQQEPKVVKKTGADSDEHGCKTSAGFMFSEVKNNCLQPWEAGVKFEKYEDETKDIPDTVYVLLSDDKSKAEIIWGNGKPATILNKTEVVEGDVNPTYFENKTEDLQIKSYKDGYDIYTKNKVIYNIVFANREKFEGLLFGR